MVEAGKNEVWQVSGICQLGRSGFSMQWFALAVGSWPTVKHGSCIGSGQVLGSPQSYAGAGEGGVQYLWLVIGVLWTVID